MSKALTVDEALHRAKQLEQNRMTAIQNLATARGNIVAAREGADLKRAALENEIAESLASAEREDIATYNAALASGWTETDLRRIGFTEPDKKQRARKRAVRKNAAASTPAQPMEAPQTEAENAAPVIAAHQSL